ncbi:MAG: DNA repair protein RecN [Gemmatimonadota bacterium]
MLTRLRISQYALIDDVEVALGAGLNVLTGETGAGKSILIEGLELLLGGRATTAAIREGSERATIEGLFVVGGEETLVRRDIFRDRSSRASIDGELATAKMIRERIGAWVEIHGQHEDTLLLKRSAQREMLDAFAGARELADRVDELSSRLTALDHEREQLAAAETERAERLQYLRSQVEELTTARIEPEEEERLAAEGSRLAHAAERRRVASEIHETLAGDDRSSGAVLAGLQRAADRLAEIDPDTSEWRERLAAARYEIEELGREALRYADQVEDDPSRLAALEERRHLLFRLKRKHGATLAEVVERGNAMAEELVSLEVASELGASLHAERAQVLAKLAVAAVELAEAREAAVERLVPAVELRLRALGMAEGSFGIELERRADPDGIPWRGSRWAFGRGGIEEVRFLIAPNSGESPRPLAQIASGGELSRALLALEAALAAADRTPTLVFDEIDAGIGGAVAHRVATELASVARHHQVVVVTHLAQIAAVAHRHIVVEKHRTRGRSVTVTREVGGEERVREISRLLGGDPERDVSRAHAEALLAGKA